MITLPANFEADIQGQNLNLYPIIAIGEFFISTKSTTINDNYYKPLLLNIPSIKESMDFENRNYKISNVTLKISNYEYEGERFSDYAGNLINAPVVISWVSQSESVLEVYKGFIRRYSHDEKTVNLSLEDSTQKDLHKDVPRVRLPDEEHILSRYRNKVVPMVYGHCDKSPCVISNYLQADSGNESGTPTVCSLLFDSKKIESFNESEEQIGTTSIPVSSLYFFNNDTYYNTSKQLSGINNFIYNLPNSLIDFETDLENLTTNNALGIIIQRKFVDVESVAATGGELHIDPSQIGIEVLNGVDGEDDSGFEDGNSNAIDGNDNTFCLIKGLLNAGDGDPDYSKESVFLEFKLDYFSDLDPAEGFDVKTYIVAKVDHGDNYDEDLGYFNYWGIWYPPANDFNWVYWYTIDQDHAGLFHNEVVGINPYDLLSNDDYNSYSSDGSDDPHWLQHFNTIDAEDIIKIGIPSHGININDAYDIDVYLKIYHVFIYHELITQGIKDKDFYANVNGRIDNTGFYE